MKYLMFVLIMAGLLTAIEMPDETRIDNHNDEVSYESLQGEVLIDSTCMLWTQLHEVIAYSPIIDGIQVVNRNLSPTGILNVHQTDGSFSFWVHDNSVYSMEFGRGCYPTSVVGTSAYISFPTSDPTFGHMVAQYEAGGWFSGFWANPVDLSGDIGAVRCIGKELPDGNILFIGSTRTPIWPETTAIVYQTWDAGLANLIDSGTIATEVTYWGFDINGGIAYVFYYENWNSLLISDTLVYYKTTTDGITWSAEQTWSLAFTPPYPNTDIIWRQMALTDDGQPRLVFDAIDDSDATYPWYGKIYVSHTSGVSPVELTAALADTETIYPTIACGGEKAVAIFNVPRHNENDSLNWWDIHYCYSTDNGITWSAPINLTESSTDRVGLQQIAKRVDTLRNQFFYIYVVNAIFDIDPLWDHWFGERYGYYLIYCCYAPIVGIEENEGLRIPNAGFGLEVYPNPFSNRIDIRFQMEDVRWKTEDICLKIYDASGRLVKNFPRLTPDALRPTQISWDGTDHANQTLPAGVYFLEFEAGDYKETKKLLLVR